ncbi:MAG: replication-associated recombination protein A [Candidatus Latescibacteria bacterium]|nr:replication-associated recombination protein A [Candidatus Latescibacterota bacterium]
MDLFETAQTPPPSESNSAPLADRMRPRTLDEFVGQRAILSEGTPLRAMIEKDQLRSIILWGPPGTGKTSLAHIIAHETRARFVPFSAVVAGIKEIKEVIARAAEERRYSEQRTLLFIDEIHRFNKAQQDAFLPHVENGTIVLIGATTENPSFEVNAPLLSRSQVFVLNWLNADELKTIVQHALEDHERGIADLSPNVEPDALDALVDFGNGDARKALNLLEFVATSTEPDESGRRLITAERVRNAAQRKVLSYDKSGDEHYDIISAFHKSLRGSDPDAALYWLARMLEAGEDPLYIARRMVRFASEDVGNADPQALSVTISARDAFHFLGSPEGDLALAQAAIYLATAPKSNAAYVALDRARSEVRKSGHLPVPMHIRNAPTGLMKDLGYGAGYQYDHDAEDHYAGQEFLPERLKGQKYYAPTEYGFERKIKERLAWWERRKRKGDS